MNRPKKDAIGVKGIARSKKALKKEQAAANVMVWGKPWGWDKVYLPPRMSQQKRRRLERQRHR